MKWEHFLRPEEEPAEGGMVGFRRQLLLFLGLFTFQGAFFFTPWATAPQNPPLSAVAAIVWSLALAIVTLLMRSRWPRKASWFYVLGGLLAATLVVYAFRNAIAPAVFALPVLTAGLLLGLFAGVTVGVGAGCLLVGLAASGANIDLVYWLLITGAITGIGALAGQFVSQVDYWERALVLQQQESIERLRDHQGELNRTLKALDEAYVSLQRTNAELALARRQAEEARALKEHFVASVSHELRTPLNIIVGFAEMMYLSPEVYEGVVWTPALEGDIQEMYRASRHLRSLVDDILDLSRIDASRLPMYRELADIRVIVNDAAETMAPLFRQRGLFLKVKLPEDLPLLFIDRTRIRQVLLNLLNNALRFTDKGGVHIQVEQGDRAVTVGVHDTGVGIPEDKLELIFEEFAQADPALHSRGGAGLGLALSRQFVKLHGGAMWVQSVLGQGSSFYFSLPLPGVAQGALLKRLPDRRRFDMEAAPILVVDPDPSIPEMLSRYLGDHPIIGLTEPGHIPELVEKEHPLAIIENLPPDAPDEKWLGPPDLISARYGVPFFRCSIPSPSWLRQASGFDDLLTKPLARAALDRILDKYGQAEGSRLLVVDDDPGFVRLLSRMLEKDPRVAHLFVAYGGEHALRLARAQRPDLILLDLLMPNIDGFQVLQALRSEPHTSQITIVAVTATSYAEEALLRHGSRFVLTQSNELSTGTVVDLLSAALKLVEPHYVQRDEPATASSM